MNSRVGPNPSRIVAHGELVCDFALTWTPLLRSSVVSDAWSQNDGTWDENRVVGVAFESFAGYRSLVANVPWIVSLVEEIDFTWPA